MDSLVFVFAFLGLVTVAVALSLAFDQRRRQAWEKVANRLGLSYRNDKIVGRFDGTQISVILDVRDNGRSRREFTIFTLQLNPGIPNGLVITRERILSLLSKAVGSQDVRLEIEDLDPELLVKGKNEDEIRAWAQRENVSRGLRDMVALKHGTFRIQANRFVYEYGAAMVKTDDVEACIRELAAIAVKLAPPVDRTLLSAAADFEDATFEELEETFEELEEEPLW